MIRRRTNQLTLPPGLVLAIRALSRVAIPNRFNNNDSGKTPEFQVNVRCVNKLSQCLLRFVFLLTIFLVGTCT